MKLDSVIYLSLLAATLGLVAGCATQTPALNLAESAQTYDGLYAVENVKVGKVWARADFDLSGYSRIILEGAGIQYRPVKGADRRAMPTGTASAFPLTDEQKQRLADEFRNAFEQELAKSERFEITAEPGPDVLLIRGALLDVVSRVPPEPMGASDIYLDSVGEATLLIELIDSESGAVLIRAVDRRAARQSGYKQRANSVRNWQEVRRLAQSWASMLRKDLDSLDDRMTIE